ncbi:Cof-type HAD-IIB family hydrolase [Chengkuizengella axinellae]|uniref:Cof-type HAD-IIB family hydrolase n=1 Tax=Chengkuizengella axinellae TaxID=3064388 RepID=A0ABT9IZM7_9BACL|nr:Cof-type HAD-IIB family hydrolase [Chengkuizengella sp. 2205SS18-9]MDP5274834.1 Cof-type HAD-IIB family hydrolase [Chengkuizengella sp. 2205SS18-9]
MRNYYKNILLVTDMDGTLLNSENKVSDYNKRALELFVKEGGMFTVATGRMEKSVMPYLSDLPINVPGVLYNGGVLYDFQNQKRIWSQVLPDDFKPLLEKIIASFPGIGVEIYQDQNVCFVAHNEETEKHCAKEGFDNNIHSLEQLQDVWQKVMLVWEPSRLNEVESYLKQYAKGVDWVRSEPQFLEVLAKNVNKGNGLNKLKQHLNLSQIYTVGFGDNLNDMTLLASTDIGIAVENAHDQLKRIASYSGRHHDDDALADFIYQKDLLFDLLVMRKNEIKDGNG